MAKVLDPHLQKRKEEIDTYSPKKTPPVSVRSSKKGVSEIVEKIENEEFEMQQKNQEKFYQLIERTQSVLWEVKTVFPFDFFPDILSIDQVKLTFTRNMFFYSSYTESIPIANLINVDVEASIIFAALRVSFVSYPTQEFLIKPLWKEDARKARDIIAGLMVAVKERIDTLKVHIPDVDTIAQMGQSGYHP